MDNEILQELLEIVNDKNNRIRYAPREDNPKKDIPPSEGHPLYTQLLKVVQKYKKKKD